MYNTEYILVFKFYFLKKEKQKQILNKPGNKGKKNKFH